MKISNAVSQIHTYILSKTAYQYGRLLFLAAVSIVLVTISGVLIGEFWFTIRQLSFLIQNTQNNFFSSSLNVVLSIISLVFVVVIFLIQNANQEYPSRLSSVILRDRYFLGTIFFVLTASLYNISGSYFSFSGALALIGYSFSIATVLLVVALVGFAGYFINISNIIDYTASSIISDITTQRLYRSSPLNTPIPDNEYIDHLSNQTQLITSSCITAIEQNQRSVVNSCLTSLVQIAAKYLDQTSSQDASEDFLDELNDQFQFIESTAFQDYTRQKYAEQVAEAVGNIGVKITQSRELGSQGNTWANLLTSLFSDSLKYDRTTAAQVAIRAIGNMGDAAIQSKDMDSAGLYRGELNKIAIACAVSDQDYHYTLLQSTHQQYQRLFASHIRIPLPNSYPALYDIEQLFEAFSKSYLLAYESDPYYKRQIISAGSFGLSPFAGHVAKSLASHSDPRPHLQQTLSKYLNELVEFMNSISSTKSAENDLYAGYTQMLYAFEQFAPLDRKNKTELIADLNITWIRFVRTVFETSLKNAERVDRDLLNRMSDFTALLIYFHRDDPSALSKLIEPLADLYIDLSEFSAEPDKVNEQNLTLIYKQLKLAGVWVNQFYDPDIITPTLWDVLVEHYYEIPESRSAVPRSTMAEYGYPTNIEFDTKKGWWLRPDTLWHLHGFQDSVYNSLNNKRNYSGFHTQIKKDVR